MAKEAPWSARESLVRALVAAGVIEDPKMIQAVSFTVSSETAATFTVTSFAEPGQTAEVVDQLVSRGYQLVPHWAKPEGAPPLVDGLPPWLVEVLHVVYGFAGGEHEGAAQLTRGHAMRALCAVPAGVRMAARIAWTDLDTAAAGASPERPDAPAGAVSSPHGPAGPSYGGIVKHWEATDGHAPEAESWTPAPPVEGPETPAERGSSPHGDPGPRYAAPEDYTSARQRDAAAKRAVHGDPGLISGDVPERRPGRPRAAGPASEVEPEALLPETLGHPRPDW